MAEPIKIIGIDPGTDCGWAVRGEIGIKSAGTWILKLSKDERSGERYLRLRKHLADLLDRTQPLLVAYEDVKNHKGVLAAHIYGGIVAVLMVECELRGIPYIAIPVGTIKKRATGKGNVDKPAMVRAARQAWPGFNGDHNEADARWIAETAWIDNSFAIEQGLYDRETS